MEQQYYIEFSKRVMNNPSTSWDYSIIEDYDYIWAESENDARDIIESIYGNVEITLIEEYEDKQND